MGNSGKLTGKEVQTRGGVTGRLAEPVVKNGKEIGRVGGTEGRLAKSAVKRRRPQHVERIVLSPEERRDREAAATASRADRYITRKGVVRSG